MWFEILKNIGLVTIPFSIYFAWKKVGYRVAASYSWQLSHLVAPGIGTVTLINMKDRPLAIFSIHAVMDDLSFNLKELNPPLILKAMEAVTVEIEPVSERYLGNEVYEWRPTVETNRPIDIYLSTAGKTIKCRRQGPSTQLGFAMKRGLRMVMSITSRYNGIIYNDDAKYAIIYTEDRKQKTSFIDRHGIIHWNHLPNGLQQVDMKNIETVKAAIAGCGLAPIISPFVVEDLDQKRNKNTGKSAA